MLFVYFPSLECINNHRSHKGTCTHGTIGFYTHILYKIIEAFFQEEKKSVYLWNSYHGFYCHWECGIAANWNKRNIVWNSNYKNQDQMSATKMHCPIHLDNTDYKISSKLNRKFDNKARTVSVEQQDLPPIYNQGFQTSSLYFLSFSSRKLRN